VQLTGSAVPQSSIMSPFTPLAALRSWGAPTASVAPSADSATLPPNWASGRVAGGLMYASRFHADPLRR
jgi:hypothetical protein